MAADAVQAVVGGVRGAAVAAAEGVVAGVGRWQTSINRDTAHATMPNDYESQKPQNPSTPERQPCCHQHCAYCGAVSTADLKHYDVRVPVCKDAGCERRFVEAMLRSTKAVGSTYLGVSSSSSS
jgi:hypothetical protein